MKLVHGCYLDISCCAGWVFNPEVQLLDASRLRHEAVTPSAASLSCTCRHGYRVNQLFIWDMFGCAPITPVDMWRKRVIPSGQKCCEASHFCCFAGSVWEPPWKTESRGSFWNFGTRFSIQSGLFWKALTGATALVWIPLLRVCLSTISETNTLLCFFSWNMEAPFKNMQNCCVVCFTFSRISGQFWYITVTFLPVPTSFIS